MMEKHVELNAYIKTNWFTENNRIPALGTAVLMLRGAVENLDTSLKRRDQHAVRDCIVYGHEISRLYLAARKQSRRDTTFGRAYANAGDEHLEDLKIMNIIGQALLSSTLKLCHR